MVETPLAVRLRFRVRRGDSAARWTPGDLAPLLIDRGGNMAPTVWCDGRVVGGWTQRVDGEIGYRLVEDIGAEATTQVAAAAERLASWVGPARLSPRTRLRPPLERDLLS